MLFHSCTFPKEIRTFSFTIAMPLLHLTNLILQTYILNNSYKRNTNSFELSNKDDQIFLNKSYHHRLAAAKSLQSCPTLCNPIDGSPPGASIPGILQARILEWVAISFSNACMHAKSLQSRSTLQPYGQQPTRLLYPWDFLGKSNGVGCHCLLQPSVLEKVKRDERNTQLKIDFWATKRNQHEFLERKMG